jgi:hypothetical protein
MALLAIGRWLDAPAVCSMLPAPRSGLLSRSIAGAAFLCYSNAKQRSGRNTVKEESGGQ